MNAARVLICWYNIGKALQEVVLRRRREGSPGGKGVVSSLTQPIAHDGPASPDIADLDGEPFFDEHNPSPVFRFDATGRIIRANLAAEKEFGRGEGLPESLVALLPGGAPIDWAHCIRTGSGVNYCTEIRGRAYHMMLVGLPEAQVGHLYAIDITEYRRLSGEADSIRREYQRQLKELACIYGLAESISVRETVAEICHDVVQLIPPAWSFPEIARARILLDGNEFCSEPFDPTCWGQSAVVKVDGVARGMVQVYYVEQRKRASDDGMFLAAERQLLDGIARTLGEAIARRETEVENREKSRTLAQERNQFETILRGIGEGVVVTDSRTRVVMLNPAAQLLLGLLEEEALGADFLTLVPDQEFGRLWRETAATGGEFAKVDLAMGGDSPRTYWATRSAVHGMGSGEAWHVTILQDVTREREIARMKSDFVSAVSHELRTPMTSIKGFVTTLLRKRRMPPETRNHFLSIIDEEADRLIMLIEELLLIARIESGKVLLEREPVNLGRIVERVTAALSALAEAKDIQLVAEVAPNLAMPMGDAKKLHMVLHNLIENAIKFSPGKSLVRINAANSEDGAEVVLQVADSGVGIDPAEHERIFERFYQVHRDREASSGTGLGLFIVREMVTLHGGAVRVDSAPGRGSTFTVVIPLRRGRSRTPEAASPERSYDGTAE